MRYKELFEHYKEYLSNLDPLPGMPQTSSSSGSDGSLADHGLSSLRHAVSTSALASIGGLHGNVYLTIWKAVLSLLHDPYPEVIELTTTLVSAIRMKVK